MVRIVEWLKWFEKMNKYILLTLLIGTGILFNKGSDVFAQSPTSSSTISPTKSVTKTPTPTPNKQDLQIEKIKDLVASRVAELKLVDKRGFIGKVKSTSNTQIIITSNGNEQNIDIDELTKFDNANKSDFGISDIKKDDLISAIGLYNKQTEKLLARFIEIASNIPQNILGVVVEKNSSDYTIVVATPDGKKITVNIDSSTKTSLYEDSDTQKSGFTKIESGERVLVVGFFDKTNKEDLNASRIVRLPGLKVPEELKKMAGSTSSKTPTPTPAKRATPTPR